MSLFIYLIVQKLPKIANLDEVVIFWMNIMIIILMWFCHFNIVTSVAILEI